MNCVVYGLKCISMHSVFRWVKSFNVVTCKLSVGDDTRISGPITSVNKAEIAVVRAFDEEDVRM